MIIPENPNEIIIYKSNPCGYCSAAIRFLQEYKEKEIKIIDLTGNMDGRRKLMQVTGSRTVPQIYIFGIYVGGYDEMIQLENQGKLDELLEPAS
jgi:glutaredoxin 3